MHAHVVNCDSRFSSCFLECMYIQVALHFRHISKNQNKMMSLTFEQIYYYRHLISVRDAFKVVM